MLLVLFVLLVNIVLHRPLLESFLFSVALSVGMTPEMMPMIITITLAQGARRMAKQKVLVKQLSAIEDFGSVEILCSDKTGTLTEGEIVLDRHVDVHGQDNQDVLRLVYLNSHFQAGIKSPLDDAILKHATFGNLLAFAEITRTSRGALRYWVSGKHRPQIGALLRMCYEIGVPVTQLLGDPAAADFDIAPLRNDRGIQSRRRSAEVRLALEGALAEVPPPSVSELAQRLHFARSERLYQIDRGRSKMLAARHREAMRALQPKPSRPPRKCERPQMKRVLVDSLARELSGIGFQNCRAEWIREPRMHQAGVP